MSSAAIYLDHAATTPLLPAAREAMGAGLALWANPSSPHGPGRKARAALEDARERVRIALGWSGEVIFVSGASEALALAAAQCVLPLGAVSGVEHDAVLRLAGEARHIRVSADGLVAAEDCAVPALVAVQQVNSETGVVQPLAAVVEAVRGAGGLLLADCAQGAAKLDLPDADMIALSAHKFGGPIGIGALLVRNWGLLRPTGGQERGYRGGTENLPGAMAMAAALEADRDWLATAARLRRKIDAAVIEAGGAVVAQPAERAPTVTAYRMPGVSAQAQLIRFDGMGIAVSAGSACSSGSLKSSHVLGAMAYPWPGEVIRVSLGRETDEDVIDRFIGAWQDIARR